MFRIIEYNSPLLQYLVWSHCSVSWAQRIHWPENWAPTATHSEFCFANNAMWMRRMQSTENLIFIHIELGRGLHIFECFSIYHDNNHPIETSKTNLSINTESGMRTIPSQSNITECGTLWKINKITIVPPKKIVHRYIDHLILNNKHIVFGQFQIPSWENFFFPFCRPGMLSCSGPTK